MHHAPVDRAQALIPIVQLLPETAAPPACTSRYCKYWRCNLAAGDWSLFTRGEVVRGRGGNARRAARGNEGRRGFEKIEMPRRGPADDGHGVEGDDLRCPMWLPSLSSEKMVSAIERLLTSMRDYLPRGTTHLEGGAQYR